MNPHRNVGVFSYIRIMDKILTYLLILAITKDERKAKMVMNVLYDRPNTIASKTNGVRKSVTTNVPVKENTPVMSDKQREVMDAITYLKSKKRKTKEDKDKIQMLEVIMKSL